MRRHSQVVVLFGITEDGTLRAARFPDSDQRLVANTAIALGLRQAVATKPAHFAVVQKLPLGKLSATGSTVVPKVEKALYDQLIGLVGGEIGRVSSKLPTTPDEIQPGDLVLAQESLIDGWFEAVCVKRQGERLIVRWRDYPAIPPFERDINNIALLIRA
jgi:hypothetical protein